MGIDQAQLMFGRVFHERLFPKRNKFDYGIYYLAFPLSDLKKIPIAYNKSAALSFYDRDHGACDGGNLESWARSILKDYGLNKADGEITLICMPRILGYTFNPVSFWLCHDKNNGLRAVLCEVHNTFSERHTYVCAHDDQRCIASDDILHGQKLFHVSPFLEREGQYAFQFNIQPAALKINIDYYNADGKKQLATALSGRLDPMNKATLRRAFWSFPLVTFKAITLIHWQALKLVAKGIKYISRQKQKIKRTSRTSTLKTK